MGSHYLAIKLVEARRQYHKGAYAPATLGISPRVGVPLLATERPEPEEKPPKAQAELLTNKEWDHSVPSL